MTRRERIYNFRVNFGFTREEAEELVGKHHPRCECENCEDDRYPHFDKAGEDE